MKTLKILVLASILALGATFTHAEKLPKPGPLDGKVVESLPAVDTPTLPAVEKIADPTFPRALEKSGDLSSALFAWHQFAQEAHGTELEEADFAIARIQVAQQSPAALSSLEKFLKDHPTSAFADHATYLKATVLQGPEQQAYLTEITASGKPWAEAAAYDAVWATALDTGKVPQTYGLTKAENLKAKLTAYGQKQAGLTLTATAISVLPGLGHVLLQKNAGGAMLLLVWALLGWSFLAACRHRHYAYASLFALPFAAIWLTTPFAAKELAEQQAAEERARTMPTWAEFVPVLPAEEQQKPAQAEQPSLFAAEEMLAPLTSPTEVLSPTTSVSTSTASSTLAALVSATAAASGTSVGSPTTPRH